MIMPALPSPPMRALLIITATAVVAAACSSSGSNAPGTGGGSGSGSFSSQLPPSSAAPTGPVQAQRYGSVAELKDAAVAAGYPCPHWREDDKVTNAAESGTCSASDVFCIYASSRDRDRQVRQTRANNQLLKKFHVKPSVVLFGPNWSINLEGHWPDTLREAMGGVEAK